MVQKRLVILLVFLLLPLSAEAGPIVSVDMDPSTPGVQSTLTVTDGTSFTVDAFILGVEAAALLNAFEFDLSFDSSLLNATSVFGGGFLVAPASTVESDLLSPDVNFAAVTLGFAGALGSGILANITFIAQAGARQPGAPGRRLDRARAAWERPKPETLQLAGTQ